MGVKGCGRRAFGLGFGLWQVEVSKPSPQQEGPGLEGGQCTSAQARVQRELSEKRPWCKGKMGSSGAWEDVLSI